MRKNAFSAKIFDSLVPSDKVTAKERFFGFFFGPSGALVLNMALGTYLTVYYTDVLRLGALYGGAFLVILPIVSKILDAISGLIMGQLIEKTRTKQGKARPWLLISAPLTLISGIMLFAVPNGVSDLIKAIWVAVSYNLYYSVAHQMYNTSHSLMMPLSSTNTTSRDKTAVFTNVGSIFVPGTFIAIVIPMFLLPVMGVDGKMWLTVFGIFSAVAFPCILIEYYFTRERVTENARFRRDDKTAGIKTQIKTVLGSKYFVMFLINALIVGVFTGVSNVSKLYYCRYVLSDYVGGDRVYTIFNAVGQAPIGLGCLFAVPLMKKLGKRNSVLFGSILAIIGICVALTTPRDLKTVIIGMLVYAVGYIPYTYMSSAIMADCLDHVEYKSGARFDGFAVSLYSVVVTIASGVGQGLFNFMLTHFNYLPPVDGEYFVQSESVKSALVFMEFGGILIGLVSTLLFMLLYKLDKEMPTIKAEMAKRKEIAE